MSNPFTAFQFNASGANQSPRTLPARLSDIFDVLDYGADPTGATDSWSAIQSTFNASGNTDRGTIYFPPGTYTVSQRIPLLESASGFGSFRITGEGGLSIITGNFADYIMGMGATASGGSSGGHVIEKLTIINTNANGGGVRMGLTQGGTIRDLNITANRCINTFNSDSVIPSEGNWEGSLEITTENCVCSPGSNVSGSIGIMAFANGGILNCSMIGFDQGLVTSGGEGAQMVKGCYFEQCGTGINPGAAPDGNRSVGEYAGVSGCHFKNCSTAIFTGNSGEYTYEGILIEGTDGAFRGGNSQYGINIQSTTVGQTTFKGITIKGNYDIASVWIQGEEANATHCKMIGVHATNGSATGGAVVWRLPKNVGSPPYSTAMTMWFDECNTPAVYDMAALPARTFSINSLTWLGGNIVDLGNNFTTFTPGSGYVNGTYFNVALTGGSGTGCIVTSITVQSGAVVAVGSINNGGNGGHGYVNGDTLGVNNSSLGGSGSGFAITVDEVQNVAQLQSTAIADWASGQVSINVLGVSPSAYNGMFPANMISINQLQYPLATNPGAGSGGTVTIVGGNGANVANGDIYNVDDASTSTFGSTPSGGGSTHARVRWNSTVFNWTVCGT